MRSGTERSSPSDRYRRHESIILIGLLSIIVTTLTGRGDQEGALGVILALDVDEVILSV